MLYIPPGLSHWGTATDDNCITCSIGFRAPAVGDIVAEFANYMASASEASKRFKDLKPKAQANPGEITAGVIEQLGELVTQAMDDPRALTAWFGEYMTQPKYEGETEIAIETASSVQEKLHAGFAVSRDPASRFAYSNHPQQILFFVNGISYELDKKQLPLAQLLGGQASFQASELLHWIKLADTQALLVELFTRGYLFFDDD